MAAYLSEDGRPRCTRCGGSLYGEYDYDVHRLVVKCLGCGRPRRGENEVTNEDKAQPSGRTRSDEDPLGAYAEAARRLFLTHRQHALALAEVSKLERELAEARRGHDLARTRLDAALGALAGEAAPSCRECGRTVALKRGRCAECWSRTMRERRAKPAAQAA